MGFKDGGFYNETKHYLRVFDLCNEQVIIFLGGGRSVGVFLTDAGQLIRIFKFGHNIKNSGTVGSDLHIIGHGLKFKRT